MGVQALIVVLIAVAWGLHSVHAMTSTLIGGFISIAPNAYFARRFFASGRSTDPQKIVRAFYIGEVLKLVITIALVLVAITQLSILILPFLTGLVGATLGLWFAPVLASRNSRAVTS